MTNPWARPQATDGHILRAARTAHEVNRAYCEGLGDTSQVPWNDAPQWQRNSVIAGVTAIVADPETTSRESHENWMKQKTTDGWKLGAVKDAEAKTHPCMVDYDALPLEQRVKDGLFGLVVRGVLGLDR